METAQEILRLFNAEKPVGYTAEEVEKAELEVGEIPEKLKEFYLYCGKTPELHGLQDEFILPNRYSAFLKLDYIVFFNENQGVCQAAVKKADAALDDPPVYTSVDNGEWKLSAPRFSDFIRAMFDYQASICLEFSPEEFYFITAEEKAKIESMFPKLGEFGNWLYDQNVAVYGESGGRIAIMENGVDIQMNYAANNEREFERMKALLNNIGEAM